jgi:ABC-type transporter Mla subunit MlaD
MVAMANERNALHAGLFIVISIALIIAIVIGIKGLGRFIEPMQNATVTFTLADNIGGLSRGDEVRVGGAKVGVVRDIEIAPADDGSHVISVNFTLPRRFDLRKDATVAIETTVTGVSWLNFTTLGRGDALAAGDALAGKPSSLNQLFEMAPELRAAVADVRNITLPKVNDTIDTYKQTGVRATELLAAIREKLDGIVAKYHSVADTAIAALGNIRDVFGDTRDDFRTTMRNISLTTGTIKDRLPGMADKVDGFLTKITTAIDSTNVALEDVKQIASNTKDVSQSLRSIIVSNRGKLEQMIASLKTTGDNLKQASAEVRRSPWRLLYQPKPDEVANLNLYDSARQFADGAGNLSDASIALRDALKDPDVDPAQVQKLIEKLDETFARFNEVEQMLWTQVKK